MAEYPIDTTKDYVLVRRQEPEAKSVIPFGDLNLGGETIVVMAGPCSVESYDQIREIAESVKKSGAHVLRGGAYKPATYPYRFMGHREEGLRMLAAARDVTGLPVVTEVMEPGDVEVVAKYADVVQVGMRNMQNYRLLAALGSVGKPVLLKRGSWAKIDEWLGAAEYIVAAGNPNVILCERGIVSFEDHTRWTLSLSVVPRLKEVTHLPVIVDPSHGTGRRSLVPSMAKAAVAAGADGLMIEVHTDPDKSVSDAIQAIACDTFEILMEELRAVAKAVGRSM
jgi:3-deoxy-7-phosphoheptulonate synthase